MISAEGMTVASRGQVGVVHVSSAHPWTDNRVHLREARSLADAGYRVHLVAVDNNLRVQDTGVTVVRLRPRKRIARIIMGSLSAVTVALKTKASVFHLHDPELIWAIPMLRVLGKTVIYDAHEDLPSQLLDKHYIPKAMRTPASALAGLLVSATKLSTHVVAATERIAERYSEGAVTVVRNYPRLRESDADKSPIEERARSLVYVGAISESRGVMQMLDAISSEAFPADWTLELAGSIVPTALEERLRQHPAWARIRYHGVVSPDEARDIVSTARIGIVTLQASAAYVDSLPTKMFEYLAAGLPVVASNFPLWRRIVEGNRCGLLVDEKSPTAIAEAVARYASDDVLLTLHAQNARSASTRELNWENESDELVKLYDRLATLRTRRL